MTLAWTKILVVSQKPQQISHSNALVSSWSPKTHSIQSRWKWGCVRIQFCDDAIRLFKLRFPADSHYLFMPGHWVEFKWWSGKSDLRLHDVCKTAKLFPKNGPCWIRLPSSKLRCWNQLFENSRSFRAQCSLIPIKDTEEVFDRCILCNAKILGILSLKSLCGYFKLKSKPPVWVA